MQSHYIFYWLLTTIQMRMKRSGSLQLNPRGLEGHYMSISARWNVGVPPETMDKIGLPLEEELSTVRGLDSITTHGYKWGARIELRFKYGTDMDAVNAIIKQGLAASDLPDDVRSLPEKMPQLDENPQLVAINLSMMPLVVFSLSGDMSPDELQELAERDILPSRL